MLKNRRSRSNSISTTHRGKIFALVPTSPSILTCFGRCGLTNRSMAVADAELPPPMTPLVNGDPSFESILATSRDFRFSSFKKADVDMCQASFQPSSIATNHPLMRTSNTSQATRDPFIVSFFLSRRVICLCQAFLGFPIFRWFQKRREPREKR